MKNDSQNLEYKKYTHFFRTGDIFVTPPFHPVLIEKNMLMFTLFVY